MPTTAMTPMSHKPACCGGGLSSLTAGLPVRLLDFLRVSTMDEPLGQSAEKRAVVVSHCKIRCLTRIERGHHGADIVCRPKRGIIAGCQRADLGLFVEAGIECPDRVGDTEVMARLICDCHATGRSEREATAELSNGHVS